MARVPAAGEPPDARLRHRLALMVPWMRPAPLPRVAATAVRTASVLAALLVALLAPACVEQPESLPQMAEALGRDVFLPADREIIEARVPRNATLAGLLKGHSLPDPVVNTIVETARSAFDLRRLRAEQPYKLVRSIDGLIKEFEYQIDADRFLRVFDRGGRQSFAAEVRAYEKDRALVALEGTIDAERTSLVAALEHAGENIQLAIAVAEIFGGDIDFNNDLQRGDTFELLYEVQLNDGEFAGYGPIMAATFTNGGRTLRAVRYEVPGQKADYYDENGRSIRRFFLRSPLRFNPRITSGFSRRRFHPVHKTYRAHLGVDYGAPTGSPVVAVSNGVVVSAGYSGASGKMVRLRHSNGYETYYLHLSSIPSEIRPGVRVSQGEMIGRVGATGVATGPHLDYRLKKNGVFVNPLEEHKRLPPGEPVPAVHLSAFEDVRDRALSRLFDPVQPADIMVARNSGMMD